MVVARCTHQWPPRSITAELRTPLVSSLSIIDVRLKNDKENTRDVGADNHRCFARLCAARARAAAAARAQGDLAPGNGGGSAEVGDRRRRLVRYSGLRKDDLSR